MARFFMWKPYDKARLHGDFRDLITALRNGDPLTNEPEVRALIADQLENPRKPSRKTKSRSGWPYAEQVVRLMSERGISEWAAQKLVLDANPALPRATLEGYCAHHKEAQKAHAKIIEENQ